MHNRIKVMHIVSNFETGGMENGVVNICNNLDRTRFIPLLCCINGLGTKINSLKSDVKVKNMNFPEGKAPFRPVSLSKYFKQEKPHIVHTHGWGGGMYDGIIAAKLAKIPVVINGHHGRRNYSKFQVLMQKYLTKFCDISLSVSNSLKNKVVDETKIPKDDIKVIRNGVDTSLFTGEYDTTGLKKEIKDHYGFSINSDSFVVGMIASLRPAKNQILLLKAVKILTGNNHNIDLKVLLVGDGPNRELIEKYIEENQLTNICILGKRKDVPQLLSLFNLFILTSVTNVEGLSNVILEAMSSGIPVISTKSIGVEELIQNNKNGFIVNEKNIEGFSKKIEFLANNRNKLVEMSENARKYIKNNFSIEKMISQYENVYEDTIMRKLS